MPDALVHAAGVSRTYDGGGGGGVVVAVVEATFEIAPGQTIALVGPSGSGKSTLLHLIGGLDQPTTGTISWPALGTPEMLRPGPVAIAFQGPSLLPPLTVLENVTLPMLLTGATKDEAESAAHEMLVRFDVDHIAEKLPEEISGGQSQRAGLARALTGGPCMLLADEPTGQQDRVSGQHLMDALLELVGISGAALVIATHDPAIAARAAVQWTIDDGRLRTEAPCSA